MGPWQFCGRTYPRQVLPSPWCSSKMKRFKVKSTTISRFECAPLNPYRVYRAQQDGRDRNWGTLRWGWVFLERTRILSGIQFTTHFIDFCVVETKRCVGSFVHVILTRQTCGQRSSKAAERKRRALGNYFSERIYYMFLTSKCRGD